METRCDYVATVPALFITKALIDILYFRANYKSRVHSEDEGSLELYTITDFDVYRKLAWAALVVPPALFGAADDIMTYLQLWPRNWSNQFNVGIAVGHLIRVLLSLYFFGFVLYVNYFELIIDIVNNLF